MSNLYEISSELAVINDQLISLEGEISPDLEPRLDKLNLELSDKVQGIAKWIRNIESNEDSVGQEIARLEHRLKIQKKLRTRLFEYVRFCMEKAGKKKITFPLFTATVCDNPKSVKIVDEKKIPARFAKVETITTLDLREILKALKDGEEIPGVTLEDSKTHLRIK